MKITRRLALMSAAAAFALPSVANANRVVAPSPRSGPGAILGEGPLWSPRDNTLYWVDIRGKKLHALRLADNSAQSWDMPDLIDWIVLRQSGGFLVGILRTVHTLTLEPFKLTPLFEIEADKTDNRLNDAKVDAKGRLWTGTMHMPFNQKTAALYRIDADLNVHQTDAPYLCTNGPAFSRDGTRMYHNETSEGLVYVFDMAADGSLSGKQVFTKFAEGVGSPDGLTVDADDGIWVAHYNGSRISRYTPDGKLDFDIRIPAKQVTSVTFAGAGLDRLFVTTAAQPPVDADDPQAGTLFEVPTLLLRGHRGLPTNAFAG
ncbi:6-deoxy-6-sulfogluconolactonase [Asticcacaulis sp. MM231]|uniref:SMP-30/gluconolactonase/LRE family protein n=1 Tax=Asticcacaulis sp. MM231 TaxID=3157666 RepID=UPI0032D5A7D4